MAITKTKQPEWNFKQPPYQVGVDHFSDKDLKGDAEGWYDSKNYLPMAFDLVLGQTDSKSLPVWWDGNQWDGLRLKKNEAVNYWRFKGKGEEWI